MPAIVQTAPMTTAISFVASESSIAVLDVTVCQAVREAFECAASKIPIIAKLLTT